MDGRSDFSPGVYEHWIGPCLYQKQNMASANSMCIKNFTTYLNLPIGFLIAPDDMIFLKKKKNNGFAFMDTIYLIH